MALDREKINEIINDGIPTVSDQPFYKGNIAYLDDPGFPDTDIREANWSGHTRRTAAMPRS